MKEKEVIEKLVTYGHTIKIIGFILTILVIIGGLVLAGDFEDETAATIVITYILYGGLFILIGVVTELIFNWMSLVLKKLK